MTTETTSLPSIFNWSNFKWNSSLGNTGSSDPYESFMHLPGVKVTFITLYVIVIIVSLIGNGMVIFSVIRNKTLQTVRNFFILNLAVADILTGSLAGPITPMSYYLKSWIFGEFLCKLLPVGFVTFAHVSTFTVTAIAIHRYSQIVMPSRQQMSKRAGCVTSFVIWIVSLGIGVPIGVYAKLFTVRENSYCIELWPSIDDRRVYTLIVLFIQFIIPCGIMTFCYINVWRSMRLYDGTVASYLQLDDGDVIAARQTNKMLIVMVVVFVVCWLPLNILFLVFDFHPEVFILTFVDILYFIAHAMALSSTVWNPIIYAGMDKGFQTQFKKILFPILKLAGSKSVKKTHCSSEPDIKENDAVQYVTYGDNVQIVPDKMTR